MNEKMMKKLLMKTLLAFMLPALLPQTAAAYDFMVGDLCYDINADGTSVTVTLKFYDPWEFVPGSGYSNLGDVVIPETVTYGDTTYTVTGIDDNAFLYSDLTSVTIPNTVTYIGYAAFGGCSGLTSVIIGNSVNYMGDGPFGGCSGLESIIVDAGNATYDSRDNCNAIIETATNTLLQGSNSTTCIPNSVTSIGEAAFSDCNGLTSITIPNSVTSIGAYAFSAFSECSGLTSVIGADSVAYIGTGAFTSTPWFDNLPDGLVYIGLVAYKYKGAMPSGTSIEIKEGTKSISGDCFDARYGEDFSGLTSVTIPNSVTSIGVHAFSGCSGLTSVTIPNSVTEIGGGAFYGCSGLTSVTIPNSVTYIDESVFKRCSGLTSVTIGSSVTEINQYAFEECYNIAEMTCLAQIPPQASGMLYYTQYENCMLYVPIGTKTAYATTYPWSRFKDIIEIGTSLTGDVTGDGKVDVNDVNTVINIILGKAEGNSAASDVTGDGKVDIGDVNAIINKVLGK